ncbi:MAG: DNA ligase [Candidatus Omnitrophota bacterium]|nr:MAG: DNA ligase [Candidatus Omnitrophota bacterium]
MKFCVLTECFEELSVTTKRLEMIEIISSFLKKTIRSGQLEALDKIVYFSQGQLSPAFRNIEFGISEKLINKAIAQASGRLDEVITRIFYDTGDYGLVAEKVCVKQENSLTISAVYQQLYDLACISGKGCVNKKLWLLSELLHKTGALEAKYIVRIILKKMRLGIGSPTVLDSLSLAYTGNKSLRKQLERAYNLCSDLGIVAKVLFTDGIESIAKFSLIVGCPIRMALASRLPNAAAIIEKIGECAVEEKYDGFRCQVHKDADQIKIYSRNLEDMTEMFPEIKQAALTQINEKQAIFEGEAISYDPVTNSDLPFQVTVQRKRKYDIKHMQTKFPLKMFVFDILYTSGYGDITVQPYHKRRQIMEEVINDGSVFQKSLFEKVKTTTQLQAVFDRAVGNGREGIVAKRLNGIYRAGGRNFNWIKLKRSIEGKLADTIDCVIVGYNFGKGQRAVLGMGALLACVYNQKNDSFQTIAKIGTGLSENEMVKMKEMLDKFKVNVKPECVDSLLKPDVWIQPKFVVEVMADEVTRSPVHTCGKRENGSIGFALRFPRTVGFLRTDKNPEDATSVEEIVDVFNSQGVEK